MGICKVFYDTAYKKGLREYNAFGVDWKGAVDEGGSWRWSSILALSAFAGNPC